VKKIRLVWNPNVHYRVHKSLKIQGLCVMFRDNFFYGEEILAPRPTPKLEDPPYRITTWLPTTVH